MSKRRIALFLFVLVSPAWLATLAGRLPEPGNPTVLRELIVKSKKQNVLHLLAYVREYSTLTTYTDTVFMFREKTVDYMIPVVKKSKFMGWRVPRVLSSRSFYRFTDWTGKDSVSDRCSNHFSWGDRLGIIPDADVPRKLRTSALDADTVMGKYQPAEIWRREDDRLSLYIDVLADSSGRRWVPDLKSFFDKNTDFERFELGLNYYGVVDRTISPVDLESFSFDVESTGRGRSVYVFDPLDKPYCVSTQAEVYIIDREFITVKEARKWEQSNNSLDEIYVPDEMPDLPEDITRLIERVQSLDHTSIRTHLEPNKLLVGLPKPRRNFGQNVLMRLKQMFGIDYINANRKWRKSWNEFRRSRGR